MPRRKRPHLTIVGGQPEKPNRKQPLEVPIGLEQLLVLAARDGAFKRDLLSDR